MGKRTVKDTVNWNLCSSCGICKNVCPLECISWQRDKGMYKPLIDEEKCVKCGICAKVCPGLKFDYGSEGVSPNEAAIGKCIELYNAWSRNEEVRHVSASGGIISTIIRCLLENGVYDTAFCVDAYDYSDQLTTKPVYVDEVLKGLENSSVPKSRYLPVSHENAVLYLKQNPDKRVILIGTSCAIRGLQNVISHYKLNRENYLLIGLFCDRVFNYNIYDYFSQDLFCEGKKLEQLHFKNKESGGWPGNMKLIFSDGSSAYVDKSERGKAKDYFMPERCMYCIDKLNVSADISLGDNYTGENDSPLGSNSVIIRTEAGLNAWNISKDNIEYVITTMDSIAKGQYLEWRLNNYHYSKLKQKEIKSDEIDINKGVESEKDSSEYRWRWKKDLEKLRAGEIYCEHSDALDNQFKKAEKEKKKRTSLVKRVGSKIYRLTRKALKG